MNNNNSKLADVVGGILIAGRYRYRMDAIVSYSAGSYGLGTAPESVTLTLTTGVDQTVWLETADKAKELAGKMDAYYFAQNRAFA